MNKIYQFIPILLLFIKISALTLTTEYEKFWHNNYNEYAIDLVETKDSGYIIVGNTDTIGSFAQDIWVIKINQAGDTLWNKTYGGTKDNGVNSIIAANDSGYLIAAYQDVFMERENPWLLKIDDSGDTLWTKSYHESDLTNEQLHAITPMDSSSYLLYCTREGDRLLIKIDESGDTLWTKITSGSSNYFPQGIYKKGPNCYLLVHSYNSNSALNIYDIGVTRVDSLGDYVWSNSFGGSTSNRAYASAEGPDSSIFVGGYNNVNNEGRNFYVAKINNHPSLVWEVTWGGFSSDTITALVPTKDGGVLAFGNSSYSTTIAKIDSLGIKTWEENFLDVYVNSGVTISENEFLVIGVKNNIMTKKNFWAYKFKLEQETSKSINYNPIHDLKIKYKSGSLIIQSNIPEIPKEVEIFNSQGRLITTEKNRTHYNGISLFNLKKGISKGTYFIRIQNNSNNLFHKIIVE